MGKFMRLIISILAALIATYSYAWIKSGFLDLEPLFRAEFGIEVSSLTPSEPYLLVKQVIIFATFFFASLSLLISRSAGRDAKEISKRVERLLDSNNTRDRIYVVSVDKSIDTRETPEENGQKPLVRVGDLSDAIRDGSKGNSVAEDIASICDKFENTISISESLDILSRAKQRWIGQCESRMTLPQFSKVTLPLIGFAGTIFGIMGAMGKLQNVVETAQMSADEASTGLAEAMIPLIQQIGVAFDTTLIALVGTALLIYKVISTRKTIILTIEETSLLVERELINSLRLPRLEKTIEDVLERIAVQAYLRYDKAKTEVLDDVRQRFESSTETE